jgi:hypothetical protein
MHPMVATRCLTCRADIGLWSPPRIDSGYTHILRGGAPDWDRNRKHEVVPGNPMPFPPDWLPGPKS